MITNEIRKQIVKLMEKRDRAFLDSKSPEEAKEVADNCDRKIRMLYSQLAFETQKENTLAEYGKQLKTIYKNS